MRILLIPLLVLLGMVPAYAAEFVQNGGFEQALAGWKATDWKQPRGSAAIDAGASSAGKCLVLVNDTSDQVTMLEQGIALEPQKSYTLRCRMKVDAVVPAEGAKGAGAAVMILGAGKHVIEASAAGSWKQVQGTSEWQECSFPFTAPAVAGFRIYLVLRLCTGKVSFDDVSIAGPPIDLRAEMFPASYQRDSYHVCEGFPGLLLLDVAGPRQKSVDLILDLPEDTLTYIGSSPFYRARGGGWPADASTSVRVEHDGVPYQRQTIALQPQMTGAITAGGFAWCNFDRVYFSAKSGTAGRTARLFWRLVGSENDTSERSIAVTVLPPLPTAERKLDSFQLMMSYLWSLHAPFPEVSAAYSGFWLGLHRRPVTFPVFGLGSMPQEARDAFFAAFQVEVFLGSKGDLPMLGRFAGEVPWDVNEGGAVQKGMPCPVYAEADPEGLIWDDYYPKGMTGRLAETPGATTVVYDYEPGLRNGFSEPNRAAFAVWAGLGQTPSIAEIRGKHKERWFDYRVRQHDRLLKRMVAAHRKHFPGIRFVLCTDPLRADGPILSSWCGVDCRLADEAVDGHMHMPYYEGARYFNDVALNAASLGKPQLHLINPTEKDRQFYQRYSPEGIAQDMLANAMNGCTGIGFWAGDAFDGRYLHSIARTAIGISRVEACYAGTRCDADLQVIPCNASTIRVHDEGGTEFEMAYPDISATLKSSLHRSPDGTSFAATLLNFTAAPVVVRIAMPGFAAARADVAEAITGERAACASPEDLRRGFLAEIPGKGAVIFAINAAPFPTVPPRATQAGIPTSGKTAVPALAPATDGTSSVSWALLPGGGRQLAVELRSGTSRALLPLEGGSPVSAWIREGMDVMRAGARVGALGGLAFYDPAQPPPPYRFEISGSSLGAAGPSVSYAYRVQGYEGANPAPNPLFGLRIDRTVTLERAGAALRIAYTFTNEHPTAAPMRFGFRLKNAFYPEAATARMSIGTAAAQAGEQSRETLFLAAGAKIPFGGHVTATPWDGSSPFEAVFTRQERTDRLRLTVEPAEIAAGAYVWNGNGVRTLEPLTQELDLGPGASRRLDLVITWP